MNQNRVPSGVRTGGQYAPGGQTPSTVRLGSTEESDRVSAGPDKANTDTVGVTVDREYRPDGTMVSERRCEHGVLTDHPDGARCGDSGCCVQRGMVVPSGIPAPAVNGVWRQSQLTVR